MDTQTLYNVKTPVFEGPLELLLDLIEKRKLFINEISLAEVTDDYILHIKNLESNSAKYFGDSTAFIIIAATLILIKSKSLLPTLSFTNEEEGEIKDLEERLRLYQSAKTASEHIKKLFGKKVSFEPLERKITDVLFTPDARITQELMHALINEVINNIPKTEFIPHVEVKKVISIEEMIDKLTERIQSTITTSFREFSGGHSKIETKEQKVFVIVSFLAMLELVRQGIMDVLQTNNFDEIEMVKLSPDESTQLENSDDKEQE